MPSPRPAELAARLAEIVGSEHVLIDPDVKRAYESDMTSSYTGSALLVVRPANTDEVARVLAACSAAGAPVVAQGGHTGLVGGGTPRNGETVLSLRRLRTIEPIDRAASQVTAGAGVPLEELQRRVRAEDLDFPVDHAARGTATIGGMVATNAGGQRALRHGPMRAQVAGLEAVLPDGRVVTRLTGLLKDNAGFDLPGLLVGSEGVLAVVTRARLKLVPLAGNRWTALIAVAGMEEAVEVLDALRRTVPSLEAVDWFEAHGLRRVCEHLRIAPPFASEHPLYLVVDCADAEELAEAAALAHDSAVAGDDAGRRALWLYREAHNETVRALGTPLKLDVSLPVPELPAFCAEVHALVAGGEAILYGHLGDGNVHVNLLGPPEGSEEAVLRLVDACGGSISAEHGVGLAKARWLHLCRSETELAFMRGVKDAFDPNGILGRGRLLEDD